MSPPPTVRPISWISVIPQLLVMGLLALLWYQFSKENAFLYAALNYLILSQASKRILAKDHRKGMRFNKLGKHKEAIPYFKKSYVFFKENNWIDKYRYITLFSAARMSYKEMALNNIAFSYGQLGDGTSAKAYYEQTIEEFPNSGMAQAALNILDAGSRID